MRALLGTMLVSALVFGCGGEDDAEVSPATASAGVDEVTDTEAAPSEADTDEADTDETASDDAVPTEVDYEQEASETITEDNLEEQVTALEATIDQETGTLDEGAEAGQE